MTRRVERDLELRRGQQDRMSRMATGAVVISTDPVRGTLKWKGIRGGENTAVSHPYIGPSSWFRINPERGTKVLVSYRGENLAPYVSAYVAEDIDGSAIATLHAATESGKFWFRTLAEGEAEVTSPGNASTAWLRNGNVELRGGAVTLMLKNTDMSVHADAPWHRRTTLGSRFQHVGDEERFGVVVRSSTLDATQPTAVKSQNEFLKEYVRHLTNPNMTVPLVDHREGFVVDDSGVPVLANGAKLRLRSEYGTVSNQKVSVTIDETGNVTVQVPQCESGFTLKTVAANVKIDSGKDMSVLVQQSMLVSADSVQVNAQSIKLAGELKLLTESFASILAGANGLAPPPSASPSDLYASLTAVVLYLKTFPTGFSNSLTTKTVAG